MALDCNNEDATASEFTNPEQPKFISKARISLFMKAFLAKYKKKEAKHNLEFEK